MIKKKVLLCKQHDWKSAITNCRQGKLEEIKVAGFEWFKSPQTGLNAPPHAEHTHDTNIFLTDLNWH